MSKKNEFKNLNLENDVEIEYNEEEEISPDKTKSLTKFPSKLEKNNEFCLDSSYKNFSKSLGFNFKQCFAPKSKIRYSNKKLTPLIFKKNENICNLDTQDRIITDDAISEKESFNNDSSFSSDSEIDYENNNTNFNTNNNEPNNKIINDNNNTQKLEEKEFISKNKVNDNNNNIKAYEHKTIGIFNTRNNYNSKENMKSMRNSLYKIRLKCIKEKNREMEYLIKEKDKNKYRLDIIKNTRRYEIDNEYKIIPINNIQDNSDEENEDMSNFRTTISYSNSKLNQKSEDKGVTIYDVLKSNKQNKSN
jgi:hypothetical protein